MTHPNRTEPAPTTYFGLPVERGGVPLKAIQAREFWPRWREIMGATDVDEAGIVSLADVHRFAQQYVLEI